MQELTEHIVNCIIDTNIAGKFDTVQVSNVNEYPVIGIGLWNLDDADYLLDRLSNGINFIDLPYHCILEKGIIQLKHILSSDQGKKEQIKFLTESANNILTELNKYALSNDVKIYIVILSLVYNISIYQLINSSLNNDDLMIISNKFMNNYPLYKSNDFIDTNKKIIDYINGLKETKKIF